MIPTKEFDRRLREYISDMTSQQILDIDGIYPIMADHFQDRIVEDFDADSEEEKAILEKGYF